MSACCIFYHPDLAIFLFLSVHLLSWKVRHINYATPLNRCCIWMNLMKVLLGRRDVYYRDVICRGSTKSWVHLGSLWPAVVYIRINLRPVSHVFLHSKVTSLVLVRPLNALFSISVMLCGWSSYWKHGIVPFTRSGLNISKRNKS